MPISFKLFYGRTFVDFLVPMRKFKITSNINKDTLSIGLEGILANFQLAFRFILLQLYNHDYQIFLCSLGNITITNYYLNLRIKYQIKTTLPAFMQSQSRY